MEIKAKGPLGALLALGNLDIELHGVRCRKFKSGKVVATGMGYGETTKHLYYINGNRSSRRDALSRLSKFIADGEDITITGNIQR